MYVTVIYGQCITVKKKFGQSNIFNISTFKNIGDYALRIEKYGRNLSL